MPKVATSNSLIHDCPYATPGSRFGTLITTMQKLEQDYINARDEEQRLLTENNNLQNQLLVAKAHTCPTPFVTPKRPSQENLLMIQTLEKRATTLEDEVHRLRMELNTERKKSKKRLSRITRLSTANTIKQKALDAIKLITTETLDPDSIPIEIED